MPNSRINLKCPTCKKQIVKSADPDFPFCSDRCRVIDLGKWAAGGYVISEPLQDTEDLVRDDEREN